MADVADEGLIALDDLDAAEGRPEKVDSDEGLVSMDDLDRMERDFENPMTEQLGGVSDEERKAWELKGKIGFVEQWRREQKSRIPGLGSVPVAMLPYNPEGSLESLHVLQAFNKVRDPNISEDERAEAEEIASAYIKSVDEERIRGRNIGGMAAIGIANLPAYMLEFASSGGIATGVRVGVRKAAQVAARKILKKRATLAATRGGLKKFAARVPGELAVAAIRTNLTIASRVAKNTADRQISASLQLGPRGIELADQISESPATSFAKAYGSVFIDAFSETTGPALGAGGRKAGRAISHLVPRRMKGEVEKVFFKLKKISPAQALSPKARRLAAKLWTKGGWDGFVNELGEERVSAMFQALLGIEDFNADDPDSVFDRLISSFPNGEELGAEILVLAVPGSLHMTTAQVIDLIQKRRAESGEPAGEVQELTEEQVDRVVAEERPEAAPEEAVPEDRAQALFQAAQKVQEAVEAGQDPIEAARVALEESGLELSPEIRQELGIEEEAVPEAPGALEALQEAEEALEEPSLSPELTQALEDAGLDSEAVETMIQDFQNRVERGETPEQAVGQILKDRQIQLPQETVETLQTQIKQAIEDRPLEEPTPDMTEEQTLAEIERAQGIEPGDPIPADKDRARIDYKQMPGLPRGERRVESDLAVILAQEDAAEKYAKLPGTKGGKLLNTDDARFLSPEYAASPENRTVHTLSTLGPSSAWVRERYKKMLKKFPTGPVVLLSGGGGSGKTTATKKFAETMDKADVIFDGILAKEKRAYDRIDSALKTGRRVKFMFVYRPIDKALDGYTHRFWRLGRYIPDFILAEDHVLAQEMVFKISNHYKKQIEDGRVEVIIMDNSGKVAKEMPLDALQKVRYTKSGERPEDAIQRLLALIRSRTKEVDDEVKRRREEASPELRQGVPRQARGGGRGGPQRSEQERAARDFLAARDLAPAQQIRKSTGLTRPKSQEQISAFEALRVKIRAEAAAARDAARFTLNSVRDGQEKIIDLLEKSGLEAADRAKFIRFIKNIQSVKQYQQALPELLERIERIVDTSAKRKTLKAIRKELRKIQPTRVSGRLQGRFTPTIQEILSRMKKADRLTPEEAQLRLEENLSANESGNLVIPSVVVAMENRMLNAVANRAETRTQEYAEILRIIKALKTGGRALRKIKQFKDLADIQEKRDVAKAIIDSRPEDRITTTARESADDTRFGWYNRATAWLLGWNNLMNRLSWNDKSTKTNKSRLNAIADVAEEETREKRGIRLNLKKVRRMWTDAFGEMSDWQLTKRWAAEGERVSLGNFVDKRGRTRNLEISKAEARKRWMEFQDPTLHETFFGQSENSMGWTEEMRKAIEGFLSPADLQFARAQLAFYQQYYRGFNEVFSDINGVNLPKNENYSPIRRRVDERSALENELLQEMTQRRSVTPSAGKLRVENLRIIDEQNDVEVIQKHIQQVEHYKAWARKIRTLNGVFNDEVVREAIRANFGSPIMGVIDRTIEDFTRGGIDRSRDSKAINTIKNNYTVAVLSGKVAITVKQLMSFPAFADAIPTAEFIRGLADFGVDTAKKMRILASSEVMRSRGLSITPEMSEAVNTREYLDFQLSPTLRNFLLTLTRWGDRGAIYLGGWSVYRYHREVLKEPHSKAIKAFEDSLSSSQQSADLSQTSLFQRGNSWQRLFSVFLSAPNQYFRKELSAIDDAIAGRISKAEAAKVIAIYHFILPMLFQFAADGLEWRTKEQIRAGLLGSFNGFFILGQAADNMLRAALGLRPWSSSSVIDSVSREIQRLISSLNPDDLSAEAFFEIIKNALTVAGVARGLPAQQAVNIIEGFEMMSDAQTGAEWTRGMKRVFGWSEYAVNQGEKPKKGAF